MKREPFQPNSFRVKLAIVAGEDLELFLYFEGRWCQRLFVLDLGYFIRNGHYALGSVVLQGGRVPTC
ncbi:hypothetical protein WJ63_36815 [Burkholderia pyrrocinia]|nr:hypothetical protein WJ63_36815 [Burkholderia pyrrocinia]